MPLVQWDGRRVMGYLVTWTKEYGDGFECECAVWLATKEEAEHLAKQHKGTYKEYEQPVRKGRTKFLKIKR